MDEFGDQLSMLVQKSVRASIGMLTVFVSGQKVSRTLKSDFKLLLPEIELGMGALLAAQ